MSFSLELPPTFAQRLADADRGLAGMWLCSGSMVNAEIAAGSGLDWILIDGEHAPLSLESIQTQLQILAAYPATPVVRVPVNNEVIIKQYLDLGAQNLLVPMVNSGEDAAAAVRAVRYPPAGVRGVGAALSRGGRWNRVDSYLKRANDELVSLFVQIESADAVDNVEAIVNTDGVDGIFIGPSDLAASMGFIGQQTHPDVLAGVRSAIAAARAAGKPVGINAFDQQVALGYLDDGMDFILVAADVSLLARASEHLADTFIAAREGATGRGERASY